MTCGNARCSEVPITERELLIRNAPSTGVLELVRYADGPIPRFGSCYFVLRPTVSGRTSFTFAGSEDPRATERLGMIGQMDNVMAALFGEIEAGGMAAPPWPPFRAPTLGLSNVTVASLLDVLRELASPRKEPADLPAGRVLDTQIEAQVHGPVNLQEDIELLVADPAFAPTTTGKRCGNSLCDTDSLCAGIAVSG